MIFSGSPIVVSIDQNNMKTLEPCNSLLFPVVQILLEQTLDLVNRIVAQYVILFPNVRPASILVQLQQVFLTCYFDLLVMPLVADCGEAGECE